ncbi:MAG: hypothetical protein MZV70_05290 [Desulfobacterales bacterium]|nr:hypothetical protein [Desulfobacterales bacterium]
MLVDAAPVPAAKPSRIRFLLIDDEVNILRSMAMFFEDSERRARHGAVRGAGHPGGPERHLRRRAVRFRHGQHEWAGSGPVPSRNTADGPAFPKSRSCFTRASTRGSNPECCKNAASTRWSRNRSPKELIEHRSVGGGGAGPFGSPAAESGNLRAVNDGAGNPSLFPKP